MSAFILAIMLVVSCQAWSQTGSSLSAVVLFPSDKQEDLYCWRNANCTWEAENRVSIELKSPQGLNGSLSLTLPLEFSDDTLESLATGVPEKLSFKDRLGKDWRISETKKNSHCRWKFFRLKDGEEGVEGFSLALKCYLLDPINDTTYRPWIEIPPNHPIVCRKTEKSE